MGANGDRCRATSGHAQPLSVQLNSTSGHIQRHGTTLWECLLSSRSQVRILLGAQLLEAQFTNLFSALCPMFGSQSGSQSPGTSRGETTEFWIQPGWARTGRRAMPAGHSGRCHDDAVVRIAAWYPGIADDASRLRARNELVGLRRPSAQIDHSHAPAHPGVGRTPTGPEA